MKRSVAFVLAVSMAAFAATEAMASGSAEERAACSPDVQRFCKQAGSDEFVVLGCLKVNRAKLTKACLKVLTDNGQ
jgi:hypothetical protein